MENSKITLGVLLALSCLIVICLLFILDTTVATSQSLGSRVTWLEDQMIKHTKPIIQVNRATIYNTEGEIVVETLDTKEKK